MGSFASKSYVVDNTTSPFKMDSTSESKSAVSLMHGHDTLDLIKAQLHPSPDSREDDTSSSSSSSTSSSSATPQKTLAIFLDYDGTLTPIVSRPEDARATSDVLQVLVQLAQHFPTSIVTGRPMKTIQEFIQPCLGKVCIAASHGFHIGLCPLCFKKSGSSASASEDNNTSKDVFVREKRVGEEYLPALNAVFQEVSAKTTQFAGIFVENNGFSVSVHYRNLINPEHDVEIEAIVDSVLSSAEFKGKLEKTLGKKVFEIRPHLEWNKGKAVNFLLKELCALLAISREDVVSVYIGDDVTDEDAFAALSSEQDFTYLVSSVDRATKARFLLKDPDEVKTFLQSLIDFQF